MAKTQSVFVLKSKYHYTFWVIFFIYNYLSNTVLDPLFAFSFRSCLGYLLFFLSVLVFNFYATIYFLNYLKQNRVSIIKTALLLIVFLSISLGLALFNRRVIQPILINNVSPIHYYRYITYWLFQFIYYFSLGAGYFFIQEFTKEKINSSNLEKEKVLIEANLLRSQVNPHFLFNTLNVLYAKSIVYSEDLADKIQKLSEIMRYAYLPKWLEDGSHAPVSEEIKHIENVIAIHEFRLSNTNIFNFTIEGDFHYVFLPPLILVTLVENILKHGHLTSENPASVVITNEHNVLTFVASNKIKTAKNHDEKSSVGIANIISRLDRYYKDKYTFTFNEENGFFYTNLTINLNRSSN